MEEIKIEKGIEIPSKAGQRGRETKFPFDSMEIGDSFICSSGTIALSSAHYYAKRKHKGFKVTQRKLPDGTCRVWRIN